MRNALILSAAFAICGAAIAEPDSVPAKPSRESASSNTKTIPVRLTDDMVCRLEAPTGSRIMTKRCYSRVQQDTVTASRHDQLVQEQIDELRRTQLYREQERALARTQGLRRGGER
jgi:hypothetical protein